MATSALRPNIKTNKQTTAHKRLEPLSLGYKHFFSAHYNPASTYPHLPLFWGTLPSSPVSCVTIAFTGPDRRLKKKAVSDRAQIPNISAITGEPTGERAGACWMNVIFWVHAGAGGWRGLVCGLVRSLPPLSAGVCTFPAPRGRPWIRLPCVHG